jgi:hypothetical protein
MFNYYKLKLEIKQSPILPIISMSMEITEYTNVPQLFYELGLDKTNCALWHCHSSDVTENIINLNIKSYIRSKKSYKQADKIFVIGQECAQKSLVNFDPRIHVWETTVLSTHPRLHYNPFWIHYPVSNNQRVDSAKHLTDPRHHAPQFTFDCLLGRMANRPNRHFIANFVADLNLQSAMIYSCFGQDGKWIAGHDFDNLGYTDSSQVDINYDSKVYTMASLFVPYKLYNNSWFTIVAETVVAGLISEKTAKPLMSRRLFVMFGAAGNLKGLQNLGFKTFSTIIDESYDQEPDDQKRWTMAGQQIIFLMQQDPREIYERALPILIHNQNLILNTDWDAMLKKSIIDVAKQL